jgi:tetratricopeptide (TPR) repeat protein
MAMGSLFMQMTAMGFGSIKASIKRKNLEKKINSGVIEKDDLTWLSSYYYEKKDYFKAESYAKKLIELAPNDSDPNYLFFNINFSKKDYKGAIPFLEKLIKDGHNSASNYHSLGFCYFLIGDNEKSSEYRLKAESIDPKLRKYPYKKI